jgi:hypothetical protein
MGSWRSSLTALLLFCVGCARYFPESVHPLPEAQQGVGTTVHDDGTVTHARDRLQISLRPRSDAELNRAFVANSTGGARATNPYTFGDWTPPGDKVTPQRFTVFLLQVKNYQFAKVRINPSLAVLRSSSGRVYHSLSFLELSEYYRSHALAWTGGEYARYGERRDLIRRTLFRDEMIFSGQDYEGFVVFPVLPPDVTDFTVTVPDVALRFNYADEPTETETLVFAFTRAVSRGFRAPTRAGAQAP